MANTHSLDLEVSSSQSASVADTVPLSITGDLTLEAWIKMESLAAPMVIMAKYDTNSNRRSYTLYVNNADSKMYFVASSDGNYNADAANSTALSTGVWYHIAVSYNAAAGTCAFYLNGVADGTGSGLDTSIQNNTSRFWIGASGNNDVGENFFDGLIDDVRVWNDIRTAPEILNNKEDEVSGGSSNLVGYWKLNNDYTDSTANVATLTAAGSPVFSSSVGMGFKFPTVTGSDIPGFGAGDANTWTNPSNAFSDNGSYATIQNALADKYQSFGTYAFGVPAGATIDGIEVVLDGKETTADVTLDVGIQDAGGTYRTKSQALTTSDAVYTLGGAADLWSGTWDAAEFSDSEFKMYIKYTASLGTGSLDFIKIKIYYTEIASSIKTVNGLAIASVKTVNGLAIASVKSINGLT